MWELMTPWTGAVSVGIGPVDSERIDSLRTGPFDQAPVIAEGSRIGLVPRKRLEELCAAKEPLRADDAAIVTASIGPFPRLDEVLELVERYGMASVGLGNTDGTGGFFTLSDLNKHPLRTVIYSLFAELEAELAVQAGRHFSDPWDWLGMLDKDKQARLVGYWELSKRDNVDVGPLVGTTLSELSSIVARTSPLRDSLGFSSRGKWDEFFGGLVDARNAIMHPVRPLFTSVDDVKGVRERLERVLILLDRLAGTVSGVPPVQ
jgi:hypothetical protein